MEHYHVRISREGLTFSAGHFITFEGNACERLHGHNYRVVAEVHGPLDENHYVVDFLALRDVLKSIVGELDHRVILPTEHPRIRVEADEQEVRVAFEDRRWVYPRSDCLLLPIPNTTTELFARHIGHRLLDELEARVGHRPSLVRIEVEECHGQWAVCELREE
ncbi:MAG: 6-pyruvoyl trahydropterin synthase family protein [Planctomycetota bacterium]|jgi:6-pyruvoyltetrahydropterin/6-carboxytetrahydropterin synthase